MIIMDVIKKNIILKYLAIFVIFFMYLVISIYLVLRLDFIQCFCQVLVGAFCLCELFSQVFIDRLQSANLTLLSESRQHTNTGKGH